MSCKEVDVVVIGGGVIGVCTAHYLLAAGRQVTLLERDAVLKLFHKKKSEEISCHNRFPISIQLVHSPVL